MNRVCEFSPCRKWRYTLWREWDLAQGLPYGHFGDSGWEPLPLHTKSEFVQFVGLNPSTADETQDDPTVRRCIGYAKSWGYGAMCMTNLFAWRETDPFKMMQVASPVGPDNDKWIGEVAREAGLVIAAWGTKGRFRGLCDERQKEVLALIRNVHCLRITKDGFPEHPLYLPKALTPVPYQGVNNCA